MKNTTKTRRFCGRQVTTDEMALVCEVVSTCSGIRRQKLAYTVCELPDWKRANGKLKEGECRDFKVTCRLADTLQHRTLANRNHGGSEAISRRMLPGGQPDRIGRNQRPGPDGSLLAAPRRRCQNRAGLSPDQKRRPSAGIREVSDECTGRSLHGTELRDVKK